MSETGTWHPLLEGEMAEEAWKVVLEVAAALRISATEEGPAEGTDPPEAGLAGGTAGLALFYSYLAEARSDEGLADVAVSYLDQAIDTLASMPTGPGLYGGFTGVGWTAEHLEGRLFEPEDDEEEADPEIDEALIGSLRRPWRADYDLIGGLAGFGVYALEALPRPAARECLELVVSQFAELAQEHSGGLTWLTPPERLPDHQRKLAPHGYFNLGVAHGVPGVIAVLGATCAAGVAPERSRRLLEGAVEWLLAQEFEADAGGCFPSWVGEGIEPLSSRSAWCYGDPGVAVALLGAARSVGREDWEQEALRIAQRAAERPPESSGIQDAGLCHGAAGLGHLFNRLYQATGEEKMAEAARYWFRRALGMRRPGEGIAGYLALSMVPGKDDEMAWTPVRGFLTGAAGIGLALIAAVSATKPEWDRVLLSSIP
ncbi:MAG: lanthionine synthetase C family protein [bacterium]|nr:lanthionine synthetase C family protein [bacterium]